MNTFPVSRRVNGERLVLAGWSRAIVLQMAHPLIAAGVAAHSSFRQSPATAVRRLHETIRAMLSLTFGREDDRQRAIAGILAIHRRVNGRLAEAVGRFPAGTAYSAEDPDLVLWVHATLLESTVMAYDELVDALTADERDAYCRESAPVAMALGARAHEVPDSWKHLVAYLDAVRASDTLAAGGDARLIVSTLLSGSAARLAGPFGWTNRLVTVGWLPPAIRSMYQLEWSATHDARLRRAVTLLRMTRRSLPRILTLWPDARR